MNSFCRAVVASATSETSAPSTRHHVNPVPRGIPDGADGPTGGDFEADWHLHQPRRLYKSLNW